MKQPRKVNHQIHWRSEQNAEYWFTCPRRKNEFWQTSVNAIITYQSLLKQCVVKVANENGDENCLQDNLSLERTRSNTSKILGRIRTQRFCGNRDQICKCEISTRFHHRVAIGRTRNYKDEQYSKESLTIRTTFLVIKIRKEKSQCRQLRVA